MSSDTAKAAAFQSQYVLKFPDKLVKQELKASAALNDRSMNEEILYLIKRGQEALRSGVGGAAA